MQYLRRYKSILNVSMYTGTIMLTCISLDDIFNIQSVNLLFKSTYVVSSGTISAKFKCKPFGTRPILYPYKAFKFANRFVQKRIHLQ